MNKLTTATGKLLDCDYFNPFPVAGQLTLSVLNLSLVDVVTIFSNPLETVQLWWEGEYVSQHTTVIAIIPDGNAVRVVLGRSIT